MYCSHCGSGNVREEPTGNGGVLFVGEELDCAEEVFDGNIKYITCDDCGNDTYVSIPEDY